MGETDALEYRAAFGLTGVDSSAVVVVTDTTVCSAVTAAVDGAFDAAVRFGPLLVLRAGSIFVAYEPEAYPQPVFYVDSAYTFKAFTR